jgi:hypothetical protein
MRSKVTVVLLFLNVLLFAYIYYYDKPLLDERKNMEARRRVLPVEIASMDSFSRISATGETVKITKVPESESWILTAPYEWPANPNAVSRIHNELQFLEHKTSFPVSELDKSGQTLADFGLAQPALTLEFTAAEKTFRLEIGANTEIDNNLYVLSPDRTRIHVVSRSLVETASLPLDDLRAQSIFTVPVFEVRSLNLQTGAPSNLKIRVRRDAASRWNFESPILARAARNAVEVTINALNALNAQKFLDPRDSDLDRAGLAAPALRITLEGNARRETLLIGHPVTAPAEGTKPASVEYYAKMEDKSVVFTTAIPTVLREVLLSSQESLRDPRVLDFDPTTVTSVTLGAPGQAEISLQRLEAATGEPGWQLVTRNNGQAPVTLAADPGVITNLLQKIQQLSVRDRTLPDGQVKRGFLTDAPSAADLERYGFNQPEREISLGLSTGGGPRGDEPSTLVLQVGVSPDQPGKAYARQTNMPFIYEIVPDILDDAPVLARHYRLRLLRELPENARLTSLALVDQSTGTAIYSQKLVETDLNWDAALAVEPEQARNALATILSQLRTLRAQGFTADTFNPDHADTVRGPQPWRYRLDYTVTFSGGAGAAQSSPSSLFLTERLGSTTLLAGTADFGGVTFTVTQELLDALFTLTYRAVSDPGPADPSPASPPPAATGPVNPPPVVTPAAEATKS